MSIFKKPHRIKQTIDKSVIKKTFDQDSKNNPDGVERINQKTTHKTRNVLVRDSRTQGCEKMLKELKKIKAKESEIKCFMMERRGKSDGTHSLLCIDEHGKISSPIISYEKNIAETFKTQKWAEHEIAVSSKQEEVDKLRLEIYDIEAVLDQKKKNAPPFPTEYELSVVLDQEKSSDPGVIRSRRFNEWTKKHSAYFTGVEILEDKAKDLKQRRTELIAAIDESACVTRLLCEKKNSLQRERLDRYYRGALSRHPEKNKMPPTLEYIWSNFAEEIYNKQHVKNEKPIGGNSNELVF